MARISAEERERKKKAMDAIIFQIFMTEGWDAVTYDRLAKELGVGKSSIQRYYDNKIMFATALQGKVFPLAVQRLDFSSSDAFVQSWMKAYNDQDSHVFREVVRMLMTNIMNHGTSPHSRGAVMKIVAILAENIGEEKAEETIKVVLGHTIFSYMFI